MDKTPVEGGDGKKLQTLLSVFVHNKLKVLLPTYRWDYDEEKIAVAPFVTELQEFISHINVVVKHLKPRMTTDDKKLILPLFAYFLAQPSFSAADDYVHVMDRSLVNTYRKLREQYDPTVDDYLSELDSDSDSDFEVVNTDLPPRPGPAPTPGSCEELLGIVRGILERSAGFNDGFGASEAQYRRELEERMPVADYTAWQNSRKKACIHATAGAVAQAAVFMERSETAWFTQAIETNLGDLVARALARARAEPVEQALGLRVKLEAFADRFEKAGDWKSVSLQRELFMLFMEIVPLFPNPDKTMRFLNGMASKGIEPIRGATAEFVSKSIREMLVTMTECIERGTLNIKGYVFNRRVREVALERRAGYQTLYRTFTKPN